MTAPTLGALARTPSTDSADGDTFDAFTDEDCLHWLWTDGPSEDGQHADCSTCGRRRRFHPVRSRGSYSCDSCGRHVFPRVGTMFERSRVPLRVWFAAIYMLRQQPDLDVNGLASHLGITGDRAKRVKARIEQPATAAERSALIRIADAVGTWERRWHGHSRSRTAQRTDTDATRLKILEATVQVIVERGYSEVRVSDVALAAGVSTATVHYHFETKHELLFAALSNAMREWFEDAGMVLTDDPVENLGAALKHAVVASPDRVDQMVWMDFSRLALRDARWAEKLEELCMQWDRRLRSIIQHGVDQGSFVCVGTVDDAVMRIQGLVDGLAERVMLAYSDSPAHRVHRLVAEAAARELNIDAADLLQIMRRDDDVEAVQAGPAR